MGKTIVVPGDILSDNIKMSGSGTYVRDGEVCAAVYGILNAGDRYISVIPLAGKYIPHANDRVIGIVTEVAYSNWIVDINAPYEGVLEGRTIVSGSGKPAAGRWSHHNDRSDEDAQSDRSQRLDDPAFEE